MNKLSEKEFPAKAQDLSRYIDHTLLRPDATEEDIRRLCSEAREYNFYSVCVNPVFVKLAAALLQDTPVKVCSVTGFPLGAHLPEVKALETRLAIEEGATEIDMVLNISFLKNRDLKALFQDIRTVVKQCENTNTICKVILETALLSDEEKILACKTAIRAKAAFVKTSTGFGPGGATEDDVRLMANIVREARLGVKASGGIRTYEDAQRMIQAGATRIGTSSGVNIVQGG